MKTIMLLLLFVCAGCQTQPSRNTIVIIHDTVYDDYLTTDNTWTSDKSQASPWLYHDAIGWLDDFRKYERGEYADTGAKNYPVKIEAAK